MGVKTYKLNPPIIVAMEIKCSKCKEFKDPSLFRVRKALKRGYESHCKACTNLQNKDWIKRNKEKHNIYHAKYEANRRKENPNLTKVYRDSNREILREKANRHRANNLPYYAEQQSRRRATVKSANPFHKINLNEYDLIKENKLTKDFYKDCPNTHHVDHIIPLTRGGLHTIHNLQYLENSLNLSKNNKLEIEWNDPRPINCLPYLSCPYPY